MRHVLSRWAAGLALLLSPALAYAKAETYYALVFNGPAEGQEAEYNRWYNEEHAPDVVSIPGFVSAQRYKRAALQFRANAGDSPPYLVVYKIVTDDLAAVYAEVNKRAGNGQTRMSKSMARGGGMNITYRVTVQHNWPAPGKAKPAYLHVVLADPRPGENAALDTWYEQHHAPDMTSVPGITGYTIGTFSQVQMTPKPEGQNHAALFRVETQDLAAVIADFRKKAPTMTAGPAMQNLWGYTYEPVGPELSGDHIRAERAAKR